MNQGSALRAKVGLTPRMAELRDFIARYEATKGCAPSYDEMRQGLGLRSKSSINRLLGGLQERGVASRTPNAQRTVTIARSADPLLIAREHIMYAMVHQQKTVRQVLESIFGKSPQWTTLHTAIEQVAVAWERLQDGRGQ
jgi:SOS-response transcriptional repressor LexA